MSSSFFSRVLRAISIAATLAVGVMALFTLPAEAAGLAEVVEVSIVNMKFEPARIEIKAGTTVRWVNKEKRSNHTVFFEKEGIAESDRLFPGESFERKFDTPGVYPYICGPHPHMTAEIVVIK
jgi:plastocyanin